MVQSSVMEQSYESESFEMFFKPEVRLLIEELDKFMIQPSSLVTYKVN